MHKTITIFIFLIIFLFNNIILATATDINKSASKNKAPDKTITNESQQFEQVIEEYKKYVSSIPEDIREEIITYRKAIAKLNKKKRLLYNQLSQESQGYLKKEQEYKKRLPLKRHNQIKIKRENTSQIK